MYRVVARPLLRVLVCGCVGVRVLLLLLDR